MPALKPPRPPSAAPLSKPLHGSAASATRRTPAHPGHPVSPEPDEKTGRRGIQQRSVQSVEVGGRLLLALAGSSGPLGLKELAARADLPPARAHPYLVSFSRLGLVEQDESTSRYALGPAALQIGLTCLHQLDPVRAATPVLDDLAARTGYAVALALWGNFGPTIVRMTEAREPLLVAMRTGTVMSVFHTATGRAFAAVMPEGQIAAVRAGALGDAHQSPLRISAAERALMREAQAELAEHGVVRAMGHPIPGIQAFSVPVFAHDGSPALVITALGHQDHFPTDWNGTAAHAVREAARMVGARLGWRGAR